MSLDARPHEIEVDPDAGALCDACGAEPRDAASRLCAECAELREALALADQAGLLDRSSPPETEDRRAAEEPPGTRALALAPRACVEPAPVPVPVVARTQGPRPVAYDRNAWLDDFEATAAASNATARATDPAGRVTRVVARVTARQTERGLRYELQLSNAAAPAHGGRLFHQVRGATRAAERAVPGLRWIRSQGVLTGVLEEVAP